MKKLYDVINEVTEKGDDLPTIYCDMDMVLCDFLKGSEDYALVVIADSKDYEIYVAEIDQFQVGSSERRAAKQPDLGNLFYSQNFPQPESHEVLSLALLELRWNLSEGWARCQVEEAVATWRRGRWSPLGSAGCL